MERSEASFSPRLFLCWSLSSATVSIALNPLSNPSEQGDLSGQDESYQTTRLKFSGKKLGNCCHLGAMNQAFGEVTVTKSVV